MSDQLIPNKAPHRLNEQEYEFGGLRFDVYYSDFQDHTNDFPKGGGATLRVSARVDNEWREAMRFDIFPTPHYHAPASDIDGTPIDEQHTDAALDRFAAELHDNLDELLTRSGFETTIPTINFEEVSANIEPIRQAMADCAP